MGRSGIAALACIGAVLGGGSPAIAVEENPRPGVFESSSIDPGFGSVRVELKGRALVYETYGSREIRIVPGAAQWRAFRKALDDIDVWTWRSAYDSNNHAHAGSWSLHIVYPDRSLETQGRGANPGMPFVHFLYAAQKLLGGRRLSARSVEELELYDLAQLRLIATQPSQNPRRQSADVRDPSGKVHRVRVGSFMGLNYGKVTVVAKGSIELNEIVKDGDGGWMQRITVMETQ